MLKKYQKPIYLSIIITFIFGVLLVFSAKAPDMHKSWLRNSKVGNKVVKIVSPRDHSYGGTGFHVKAPSGKVYIMTNEHVCALGINGIVDVQLNGKNRFIPKRIIEIYKKHDLCLIEPIERVKGISVGNDLNIGQNITTIGYPGLFTLSLSKGEYIGSRIIDVTYSVNFKNAQSIIKTNRRMSLQLTCYSRGGSSGSPVINFFGKVVGVVYADNELDQFESYAVPLKYIKDLLSVY